MPEVLQGEGRQEPRRALRCCGIGCTSEDGQLQWPADHFLEEVLTDCEARQETPQCARCQVRSHPDTANVPTKCEKCHALKTLADFSATSCKHWLLQRQTPGVCYECQYPQCCVAGCLARPLVPVSPNHVEKDGKWFCQSHRYPPCSVCRAPRPLRTMCGRVKFKPWTCKDCAS